MTTIQEVNIRLVLSRLRPGSGYHWLGATDTGYTLAQAVGEWRDPNTTPPTEAQLIAEWDVYQQEVTAAAAAKAAADTDKDAVKPAQIQAALDQIEADLTLLGSTPSNAQVLQILGRCLQRQSRIIKALRWLA